MDLKEKLKSEVEIADWDMLKPHHERGALFIVDAKLDLLDVGVAIAEDKTSLVKIWLDNNELYQLDKTDDYDRKPLEKIGNFIIIQPYVLLKLST